MEGNVMGAITLFIGIVILIGISPVILGNATQNCENVPGYTGSPTNATGWAKACIDTDSTNQSSFAIITIVPVVVAVVGIMLVLRYL